MSRPTTTTDMTRKEQIRLAAKQRADQYEHPAKWNDTYHGFMDGAEWADKNPQWISVEDELPEVGKDVLVYSDFFEEPVIELGYYRHWNCQRKQHMFYTYKDGNLWGNFSHWMPLPTPPNKDKDGTE